ncbi:MAG: glycoside hydrolase family 88 protein [Oscillospiraceae bacterium]|nr:glycoside hydrolase family 88 protein [Oscillospiraceae bacterium]
MSDTYTRVKNAMLAMQRYSWEQGFAAQALLEAGETELMLAMAHGAVMNRRQDGRLGMLWNEKAITDPGANGEAVWRAFEITDNEVFKNAAHKMLEYFMVFAPHTEDGVIYHNEVSFDEGFSPLQIWADSCYMIPPFLAVMDELNEATKQLFGIMNYLRDEESGCMFHKYDAGTQKFVRRELWATGTGWLLLGTAKLLDEAKRVGDITAYETLLQTGQEVLDCMLKYQRDDGLFHNILDKPDTFTDGTSAMMAAAFIYKGLKEKRLAGRNYKQHADRVRKTIAKNIDEFGIIHGVCGAPMFTEQGTSAEAQAAWLIMDAWAK